MAKALLALLVASATALAQTQPATSPPPAPASEAQPAGKEGAEDLRREMDAKLREVREEVRAQLATQSVNNDWQDEWVEERRKLELFELDGYLRTRPDLFHKFDLGREPDPSGYTLFPRSPTSARERTMAGVNMRLRMEPTLNVSEQVRVRMQVDALDNLVWGSTPDYGFSRTDQQEFGIFSENQVYPRSGLNAISDSLAVKRVFGEVSTPFGLLRFGRMGSHWGVGMLRNDGNCLDCDHGDTVDRVMLVTEPIRGSGFYFTPMLDFNIEGPTSARFADLGQPFDLSNSDDSHSFILAIAKRDTPQQAQQRLDNNLGLFNYGVHFTYRVQRNEASGYYGQPFQGEGGDLGSANLANTYVSRQASLWVPDVWVKYERKSFRLELEAAAVIGNINNRALNPALGEDPAQNQALSVLQFGGVLQGEVRFMNGDLKAGLELGFASGDRAPGMGIRPRRRVAGTDNNTQPGDIDGPQYACQSTGGCTDASIRNFRFNRDYRVDLILWREILGAVSDATYLKPRVDYRIAEGFNIFGALIYSRAIFASSTPSFTQQNLGVELNAGTRFETDDGFYAQLMWGILFPLGGLSNTLVANPVALETAQAIRGSFGIKF